MPHKLHPHPETGEVKTREEWAEELGIKVSTFDKRLLRLGSGNPQAFAKGKIPRGAKKKVFVNNPQTGEPADVKTISTITGHTERAIRARIARGKDVWDKARLSGAGRFLKQKSYAYPVRYAKCTLEEIARLENVSTSTVSRWASTGKWPARLLPLTEPESPFFDWQDRVEQDVYGQAPSCADRSPNDCPVDEAATSSQTSRKPNP